MHSLESNSLGGYYDDEGDFQADSSGVKKLSEALKTNSALRTLKCALIHPIPTVSSP